MNYAVEETKNIERYNFSFMRTIKYRVHKKYIVCNFPVYALYTSGLCLSLCWLVCL